MHRLNKELRDAGELVGGEGLTGPRKARLVRAGNDGRPVTDGVFPETKEFLAGYWIIEVDRRERAYEVARRADKREAQAVFISGVGMPSIDVLERLERDLGKPVLSSASAMMWNALRIAKRGASITGYGSLLSGGR